MRMESSACRAPVVATFALLCGVLAATGPRSGGAESVQLTGVPDYQWHLGCFGTAGGNLVGYWDRHGLPNFYTGPTAQGVAPLTSSGGNAGIRALWATAAGLDGRPANLPGHEDDYYVAYESVAEDPYRRDGRAEHAPDCLGDFLGLNQAKWSDLGGECSGNIDGYSFNFFDPTGARRVNFEPTQAGGGPVPDLQSGLRSWAAWRGTEAETFSQLSDFNPDKPAGSGFTFADLRAEIDAGYPVLLFMQPFGEFSRTVDGRPHQNPPIHGMLAYGYFVDDAGNEYVRYRTSWASGDRQFSTWTAEDWTPEEALNLPLRGVVGFHPRPKLTGIERGNASWRFHWEGPLSILLDDLSETQTPVHRYLVERTGSLTEPQWEAITGPVAALSVSVPACCGDAGYFRLRLAAPHE